MTTLANDTGTILLDNFDGTLLQVDGRTPEVTFGGDWLGYSIAAWKAGDGFLHVAEPTSYEVSVRIEAPGRAGGVANSTETTNFQVDVVAQLPTAFNTGFGDAQPFKFYVGNGLYHFDTTDHGYEHNLWEVTWRLIAGVHSFLVQHRATDAGDTTTISPFAEVVFTPVAGALSHYIFELQLDGTCVISQDGVELYNDVLGDATGLVLTRKADYFLLSAGFDSQIDAVRVLDLDGVPPPPPPPFWTNFVGSYETL